MTDDFVGEELTYMPDNSPPSRNCHGVGARDVDSAIVDARKKPWKVPERERSGVGRRRERRNDRIRPDTTCAVRGCLSRRDTYAAAWHIETSIPQASQADAGVCGFVDGERPFSELRRQRYRIPHGPMVANSSPPLRSYPQVGLAVPK